MSAVNAAKGLWEKHYEIEKISGAGSIEHRRAMTAILSSYGGALNMPKLSELLAGLGQIHEEEECTVSGIALDSRKVGYGDIFLACDGGQSHGMDYIDEVLAKRPVAVLWEPSDRVADPESFPMRDSVIYIAVPNLSHHIGVIASRFYGHPSKNLTMIGVTGTDGKTSCSHFIAQALTAFNDFPCGVVGTLGYGMYGALVPGTHTTPNALELQGILADVKEIGAQQVVMEVSSHALDQGRVDQVEYDVAVLTNLTRDHLDYHGSLLAYAQAKRKLFHKANLKKLVLNVDDDFGLGLYQEFWGNRPCLTYGFSRQADIRGFDLQMTFNGLSLGVMTPFGEGRIESRLVGGFNALNLLAVLGVLLALELPFEDSLACLQRICPVPGRMERFGGDTQPMVVVDFAHTPNALEQVLRALRPYAKGRLVCVFGCGGDRDRGKRSLMGEIAWHLADHVVVTSDNPRSESPMQIIDEIVSGCETLDKVDIEPDRAAAIEWAISNAEQGDVVLIAGKGHESVQIVGKRELPFDDRSEVKRILRGVSP
jgi:UDP-N-acetylmuramoyl-L-alanyl-D-glutamate--2,6-diaminopimelate ligase